MPKISYASWDSCKSYPLKGVCTLDSYAFFKVLFCFLLPVLFIFQFYFIRYFYLFKVTPKLYIPSTLNIDLICISKYSSKSENTVHFYSISFSFQLKSNCCSLTCCRVMTITWFSTPPGHKKLLFHLFYFFSCIFNCIFNHFQVNLFSHLPLLTRSKMVLIGFRSLTSGFGGCFSILFSAFKSSTLGIDLLLFNFLDLLTFLPSFLLYRFFWPFLLSMSEPIPWVRPLMSHSKAHLW